jgi:hypothetical protein
LNTLRAKKSAQKSQALQYQDFMQIGPIFLIRGGFPLPSFARRTSRWRLSLHG